MIKTGNHYDFNTIHSVVWPSDQNLFETYTNHKEHQLFWNPCFDFSQVVTEFNLTDFCNSVNQICTVDNIKAQHSDHVYNLSNIVKFNMWTNHLRKHGNIKPWLILDDGTGFYQAGNGDSRLKCLERVPHIKHVEAFVTTHVSRSHLYQGLEPVTSFDQFARLCQAQANDTFLFKFTHCDAAYGLRWYEHATHRTTTVTPSDEFTLKVLLRFRQQHPDLKFTPEWFDTEIDWYSYDC